MRFEPLGDQAVMTYCGDEIQATAFAAQVRLAMPPWCIDVVQAYLSVAIYYDLAAIDFAHVVDWLSALRGAPIPFPAQTLFHVIPCCYELGLDFEHIEQHTGQAREAIIAMHSESIYTVYAIGFCPGFPYLGYLPSKLSGVPRLASPRLKVEAGSIGLTGRQTGIYTEMRPGGWNIVGRTPLQLVDVKDGYFPLRTGDQVKFQPIDEREFRVLNGNRLT